jgi:hypothetical protein
MWIQIKNLQCGNLNKFLTGKEERDYSHFCFKVNDVSSGYLKKNFEENGIHVFRVLIDGSGSRCSVDFKDEEDSNKFFDLVSKHLISGEELIIPDIQSYGAI